MRERLLLTCVLGMLTVLLPWTSSAQTPDSLTLEQRIDSLRQRIASYQEDTSLRRIYLTEAGTAANTPSAYGGSFGSLGMGIGLQQARGDPMLSSFRERLDAIAGLSIGLGDPRKWVGVAVGLAILDVSTFKRASASLKVTRLIKQDLHEALADLSVAAGVQNIVLWGHTDTAEGSVYGVASAKLKLRARSSKPFSRLYFSVGIGNGRFSLEPDIENETRMGEERFKLFGNVAVKFIAPLNLFAEWTGQEVIVGTSVTPFHDLPFVLMFALANITGQAGKDKDIRPIMAFGVGLPLQNINP